LLDEPTASLDRNSEKSVLSALYEVMEKTSCLMVTHRLDQLEKMDRIIVLNKGQIVQQGSFDDLSAAQGLFKKMQMDEFQCDPVFSMQKENN